MSIGDTLEAENALLREFYDSWVFFHRTKAESTEQPAFDATRAQMAAQQLVNAAKAVEKHIHRMRAH